MKSIALVIFIVSGLMPAFSVSAAEDVRYVSDVLHLPLRSGKGNKYRITHKGLPSSTKLYVLESDNENGWTRVRTTRNAEGWVRSQFLTEKPTAAIKLAALEKKMSNLNSGSKKLLEQADAAESSNKALTSELLATQAQLASAEAELSDLKKISSGAIDLNNQHQKLLEKYQVLQTDSDTISAENQRLEKKNTHSQWLFGALLVIAGVILTLVLQSMSMRRRQSDWG